MRALAIRPGRQGEPTTPNASNEGRGSGKWAIASSTARIPITVCSSECRKTRPGNDGAPTGNGASRKAGISESGDSTVAELATQQAKPALHDGSRGSSITLHMSAVSLSAGMSFAGGSSSISFHPSTSGIDQAACRIALASILAWSMSSMVPTVLIPSRSAVSI